MKKRKICILFFASILFFIIACTDKNNDAPSIKEQLSGAGSSSGHDNDREGVGSEFGETKEKPTLSKKNFSKSEVNLENYGPVEKHIEGAFLARDVLEFIQAKMEKMETTEACRRIDAYEEFYSEGEDFDILVLKNSKIQPSTLKSENLENRLKFIENRQLTFSLLSDGSFGDIDYPSFADNLAEAKEECKAGNFWAEDFSQFKSVKVLSQKSGNSIAFVRTSDVYKCINGKMEEFSLNKEITYFFEKVETNYLKTYFKRFETNHLIDYKCQ